MNVHIQDLAEPIYLIKRRMTNLHRRARARQADCHEGIGSAQTGVTSDPSLPFF